MSKSIMQDRKECYFTKQTYGLHKHHIYGGGNRRISEREGFWVYLIPALHNGSNDGVHFNRDLDLYLKKKCQAEYEKEHSRDEFRALIGKSYL